MKRMIGSIAAVVLTLSLGVAAYAKATPKQTSSAKTNASAPKSATNGQKNRKRTRNRRTRHHKMHKGAMIKSQAPMKMKDARTPRP